MSGLKWYHKLPLLYGGWLTGEEATGLIATLLRPARRQALKSWKQTDPRTFHLAFRPIFPGWWHGVNFGLRAAGGLLGALLAHQLLLRFQHASYNLGATTGSPMSYDDFKAFLELQAGNETAAAAPAEGIVG